MAELFTCAICGREIAGHQSYIVRIEVLADPSTPEFDTRTHEDPSAMLPTLLSTIETMSQDELQEQVYRSFELRLCGRCQPRYLQNPMGNHRIDTPKPN